MYGQYMDSNDVNVSFKWHLNKAAEGGETVDKVAGGGWFAAVLMFYFMI